MIQENINGEEVNEEEEENDVTVYSSNKKSIFNENSLADSNGKENVKVNNKNKNQKYKRRV